jgi:hypothetical protein
MLPEVKWWRAKTTTSAERRADWFDQTQTYPGFILRQQFAGNVRVFRDLDAFKTCDGSFSVDLPVGNLDEVQPPA